MTMTTECDFSRLRCLLTCDNPSCGVSSPSKVCTLCQAAYYCSELCQRAHWTNGHEDDCMAYPVLQNGDDATELPHVASSAVGVNTNKEESTYKEQALTTCGICLTEEMVSPFTLPNCGHTFCFACISELQGYRADTPPDSIACPYCRINIGKKVVDIVYDEAATMIEKARHLQKNGFLDEAKPIFRLAFVEIEKLLEVNPDDLASLNLKASYLMSINPRQAVRLCLQTLEMDRVDAAYVMSVPSSFDQAEAAFRVGDYERAYDLANTARETSRIQRWARGFLPNRRLAFRQTLAEAYEVAGMYGKAYTEYELLGDDMQNNPKYADHPDKPYVSLFITEGLSRTSYHLKNYREAIRWSADILTQIRNIPGFHKLVALSLLALAELKADKDKKKKGRGKRGRRTAGAAAAGASNVLTIHGYTATYQSAIQVMYHAYMYEDQTDEVNKRANRILLQTLLEKAGAM